MKAFVLVMLALAVAAPAKKKKKESATWVDRIPDLQPRKPQDENGQLIVEEPEPPQESAPFKGCVDAKGVNVQWKETPTIADIAQAVFDKKKRPTVEYNPARLRFTSDVTRTFLYAHECAHHVLGHLYVGVQGVDKEQQADCWAVLTMKESGALGDDGLERIQQDLGKLLRADENHSAGLRRAGNLKWCLTEPLPQPQLPAGPAAPTNQKPK